MDQEQQRLAEELLFSGTHRPSFAKLLYFGIFDPARVLPFPKGPEGEEKARETHFLEKLKVFTEKVMDPVAIDRNAIIPDSVMKGLGEIGALGMSVPKEYGGEGFSQYSYCKAIELIARRCGSTAIFVNAHQSIGLKGILLFGTEEQKKRYIPPLARGDEIAAFSLTEPNAGSDASGVETRAEYDPVKKVWRINGFKQWSTNASIASVLTVMAQTAVDTPEGKLDKVTAFIVTPDMPGFNVTAAALDKVGIRGTRTTNMQFVNLEVPEKNILGPVGGGLRVCLTALDFGRTTFGAMCTGVAKYMLERAVEHARNRYQFKRPIGTFDLVKLKIAEIAALTYAMESATYLTAGLIDAGEEDMMLESAMLKVFASDALWKIIYETMQIYGGKSFFTDEPFERMMRDARLNMIGEGSNEVMRAFIGAVGMRDVGMQLKGVNDAIRNPIAEMGTLFSFIKSGFKRIQTTEIPIKSDQLKDEKKALEKAVRDFGIAVTRLIVSQREAIIEKQLDLNRIANCAMALYTMTAVLGRLDNKLQHVSNNSSPTGHELSTGKLYCKMAIRTINQNLYDLGHNDDTDILSVADQITGLEWI